MLRHARAHTANDTKTSNTQRNPSNLPHKQPNKQKQDFWREWSRRTKVFNLGEANAPRDVALTASYVPASRALDGVLNFPLWRAARDGFAAQGSLNATCVFCCIFFLLARSAWCGGWDRLATLDTYM